MSSQEAVLALLESNRERFLSGQEMAGQLGISRNAVWKAISGLRESGYQIEAVTRRGYRLMQSNDIISVEGIAPYLADPKCADLIHVYDLLPSTNRTLAAMAVDGASSGTVVIAGRQSAGRGHGNHDFISPEGGIYMSVLLRPADFPVIALTRGSANRLIAFGALAVCDAVEEVCHRQPMIGWVNDLYLDRRKFCGILTDAGMDFESGALSWMVLGIGIDFAIAESSFPEDIRGSVTSIYPGGLGHCDVTRGELIAAVLNHLFAEKNGKSPDADVNAASRGLMARYSGRLLGIGEDVMVSSPRDEFRPYRARIERVDESYRLYVVTEDGEERVLTYGDASISV